MRKNVQWTRRWPVAGRRNSRADSHHKCLFVQLSKYKVVDSRPKCELHSSRELVEWIPKAIPSAQWSSVKEATKQCYALMIHPPSTGLNSKVKEADSN